MSVYKNVYILEKFFLINYGSSFQSFCFSLKIMDLLPELFMLIFILYALINSNSDKINKTFQYQNWINSYIFILFLLIVSPNSGYKVTTIILAFTYLTSWYTKISKIIIICLTIAVLYASKNKLLFCPRDESVEFSLLISFSILFLFSLTSAHDFFGVFLSLEGLGISLYVLCAIQNFSWVSTEASIKYMCLNSIASGISLYGIVLLFLIVQSLDFLEVRSFLCHPNFNGVLLTRFPTLLLMFGFIFKLSAFPFHWWVADIYEGIWTPVTAFFAIVIKVGLFLFFLRMVYNVFYSSIFVLQPLLIIVSVGSMIVGNFGAFKQTKIKRFVAYASISHIGFLMLGVSSCSLKGLVSSLIYLLLYSLTSLAFFILLLNTENLRFKTNAVYLSHFYGLSKHNHLFAKYLIVILFSMAGTPPLGGFFCKLWIYTAAIESRLDLAVFSSLILNIISSYYYTDFIHKILFVKYDTVKLYYFKSKFLLNIMLESLSVLILIFFFLNSFILDVAGDLALSCLWPVNFFKK